MHKLLEKIAGIIVMTLGVMIWSINYFIIKTFAAIGAWLAELFHAPEAVGAGITILLSLSILGILILIAFLGSLVVYFGVAVLMADKW